MVAPSLRSMKTSIPLVALLLAVLCCPARGQTFKGHTIGESAEQFFSIARMSEKSALAKQYCKDYLANPKVLKAYDRAKAHPSDVRALVLAIDVDGCRSIQLALDGKDVRVAARYAAELGAGWAEFHGGRLVALNFSAKAGSAFDDVVADLGKEFGGADPVKSVASRQIAEGALVKERKAVWNVNNLRVAADEVKDYEFGETAVAVTVSDSEYLKQKEANRPSTIR
jgi:hypothetical protein